METAICAKNLSLSFASPKEKFASLKAFILAFLSGKVKRKRFLAVNNVSFEIKKGEVVGLIGRNGAGKSTLLKLVTGIARPTSGSITVNGVVAPLLALGNGLDHELTGRENIYLNGAILGYRKEFLKANEQKIIEFAELEDFIDAPVRTYSSGMTMRLAFAIATAAPPEILILDEVLAVGDAAFQAKCHERINGIINSGATVFIVSHSIENIKKMCSRAIWLQKGSVVADGPSKEICDAYTLSLKPEEAMAHARESNPKFQSFSSEKKLSFFFPSCHPKMAKALSRHFTILTELSHADKHVDACVVWEESANVKNQVAINVAIGRKLPLLLATDGFVRSVELWNADVEEHIKAPCSIMFDANALASDANRENRVEKLLNDPSFVLTHEQKARARRLMDRIVSDKLDKFNHLGHLKEIPGMPGRKKIVVDDQDFCNGSLPNCWADTATFQKMLHDAQNEFPDADIIIKLRPGIGGTKQKGFFDFIPKEGNIFATKTPVNPYALIEAADDVFVCATLFGFEAAMAGKRVHVYGMPFYAGWGITIDAQKNPRRNIRRTIEDIFYAAYLESTIWVNPETEDLCSMEEALDFIVKTRNKYFATKTFEG